MKSRTWCFNLTAFRKDITRFVPLWSVYFAGGMLIMLALAAGNTPHSLAKSLGNCIGHFSLINMIYGPLCALLLFGDLFNAKLCNATHAMPLRREQWFFSHVAAGICFSVVPNAVGVLCLMPVLQQFWYTGFLWLLGMTLHFLFFFGLGVFCCLCTGSRFAMAAMTTILNFLVPLLVWFVQIIYLPLLGVVRINWGPVYLLCPAVSLPSRGNWFIFGYYKAVGVHREDWWAFEGLGSSWWYLAVWAAVGIGLLAAALWLYRRRKLEYAGDFLAIKKLEPVFALLFTLCVSVVFAGVGVLFFNHLVFLAVGLVIGYFSGQMLLQRTVKVFRPKVFLKFGILVAVLAISIFLTKLDVLGITRWVPDPQRVESVSVRMDNKWVELDQPEELQLVEDAHKELMKLDRYGSYIGTKTVVLEYKLENGLVFIREHKLRYTHGASSAKETRAYQALRKLYSRPNDVLQYTDWEEFLQQINRIWVAEENNLPVPNGDMMEELLDALRKDCEAGNLAQGWDYDGKTMDYEIMIELKRPYGSYKTYRLTVTEDSIHTVNWVNANLSELKILFHKNYYASPAFG